MPRAPIRESNPATFEDPDLPSRRGSLLGDIQDLGDDPIAERYDGLSPPFDIDKSGHNEKTVGKLPSPIECLSSFGHVFDDV